MDKINSIMGRYLTWAIYALLVVCTWSSCNSCRTTASVDRLRRQVDSLRAAQDQLAAQSYSAEQLDLRISLEGLESSKRTLYDWNSVVRTVVRPDDRMAEYDSQIKAIREKIGRH